LAALFSGRCDLMICSRDPSRSEKIAAKARAETAEIKDCSDRDIVFAAVPTHALMSTTRALQPVMKCGSLFVDISSVKCPIVDEIVKMLPGDLMYVSIHPLFSSARARIKNTIVVPIRPGNWMLALTALLEGSGMRLHVANAEEHDKAMAAAQVIHHFALLSMRRALDETGYSKAKDLEPFITSSLSKSLRVVKLLESNLETIEMIQRSNKFAQYARNKFIEEAKKLDMQYVK
jgi:prephenate dehydrogenase